MTALTPLQWFSLACFVIAGVLVIVLLRGIKHELDQPKDRTRRDPYWFSDQAREEKRVRLATFQKQAAKGLSEESKARAHLQAVSKAGDSRHG